jgi:hypothetical protein
VKKIAAFVSDVRVSAHVAVLVGMVVGASVLAGCSSPEKQEKQAQQFLHNESSLAAAQRNASVDCDAANCDAAWALTKRYIEQHSETHITRADAVAIETDVPPDSGNAAFSATREANGTGATLTLFAQCRGMYGQNSEKGSDYDECADKILKTQNGYVTYLRSHISAQ